MTGADLRRRALRAGLVAGTVIIYLGLVGMIETFDARHLIHDVVNLSHVLLCIPVFVTAYLVVGPRCRGGRVVRGGPSPSRVAGVFVGVGGGGLVLAGVILPRLFRSDATASVTAVRQIFISVSPRLLDIITFGKI